MSEQKPLTMSAERLAYLREFSTYGNETLHELVAELDATRAAHAETLERLAQAQRDTERLEEIERRGLTLERRRGIGSSVDPWMVRASAHKALTYWTGKTARIAIDAARGIPQGV